MRAAKVVCPGIEITVAGHPGDMDIRSTALDGRTGATVRAINYLTRE